MPLRPRVQAPETTEYVPLQPKAVPVDTFVQERANPDAGSNLMRLSQALSSVAPGFQKLVGAIQEKEENRTLVQAQARLPTMSDADIARGHREGTLPGMGQPGSAADIASRRLAGERVGLSRLETIRGEVASGAFDWEKGNVEEFVRSRMAPDVQGFGSDDHALIGYNHALKDIVAKLQAERTKQVAQLDEARRNDSGFETISLAWDKALADGKTPQEIAAMVRAAQVGVQGPHGLLRVAPGDMDKFLVQKAQQLAAAGKGLDSIEAILSTPRTGANGEHVPALVNNATLSPTVRAIQAQIASLRRKQAIQQQTQAITEGDLAALSGQGTGRLAAVGDATVANEDGTTRVISAETRRNNAVREFLARSPAIARANRETAETTLNRELQAFHTHGVPNPQWRDELDAIPGAASQVNLSNPAQRDQIVRGAWLYDQLREKAPAYLNGLIKKETQEFFEAYRVAKSLPREGGRQPTIEEAIQEATKDMSASPEMREALKAKYWEIDQYASKADPTGILPRVFGGDPAAVNSGTLRALVIERARAFANRGLPADKALEEAAKSVKETTVNVNGWVLHRNAGALPASFETDVMPYLKSFLGEHGPRNPGVTASTVGIIARGGGVFSLVNHQGIDLLTDRGLARFTLQDLQRFTEARRRVETETVRRQGEANRRQNENNDRYGQPIGELLLEPSPGASARLEGQHTSPTWTP